MPFMQKKIFLDLSMKSLVLIKIKLGLFEYECIDISFFKIKLKRKIQLIIDPKDRKGALKFVREKTRGGSKSDMNG